MAQVRSQNVIQIAVVHEHETTRAVNVWHVRADENSETSDEDVVRQFADGYQENIMPVITNNVRLVHFDWVSLDPQDANAGVLLPDPTKPDVGEMVGPSLPPNNALLIHKRTPNRPRGRRDGRAYIAGLREGDVDTFGRLTAPTLTTWGNALANFFADFDTEDADTLDGQPGARRFVVLETTPESRSPGQQIVEIGARVVTELLVDAVIGTMRDRLR